MFNELPPDMRKSYASLDLDVRSHPYQLQPASSTSQMFLEQMEQRLNGLLQAYLRLLFAGFQHSRVFADHRPQFDQTRPGKAAALLESDPPKVQEINRQRIEILNKRLEKFAKVGENQKVVDAQCAAIEDVLELIRDQSVTMRDPQQVSDQLDNLVHDVEQTEETVREVEAVFEMATPDMGDTLSPLPSDPTESNAPSATRPRLRN